MLVHSHNYSHAGATVNGASSKPGFLVPKDDGPRW
jgi:hypothetical protein